jgi:hypothetical protein
VGTAPILFSVPLHHWAVVAVVVPTIQPLRLEQLEVLVEAEPPREAVLVPQEHQVKVTTAARVVTTAQHTALVAVVERALLVRTGLTSQAEKAATALHQA